MNEQTMNDTPTLTGDENPLLAGRYQVVKPLGKGGMGAVWLAEDTQLDNKLFAIKMLPSILVANKRAYRQLKNEALVAMRLVHPNIMQIRAFEENNGNPFLVMDYIEGQTLDDYLADKGALSEEETVRLLAPVAAALDYAHGEGVVHRDVKPANVMIRKDGRPFVLDFGIACEIQETMKQMTGRFASGTLRYMSPEQLTGEPPKPTHDVYSFSAMVYECLKGEPPFVRGQIEYQIVNNPPPPLPQGIASWLVVTTIRGLAKKANERPTTCSEILSGSSWGSSVIVADGIKLQTQIAIKAYQEDDCERAFAAAQKADTNNAEIQYIIGWCYEFGEGVEEDCVAAMQWYRKAVEQGHVMALYQLSCLYRDKIDDDPYFERWSQNDFEGFENCFLRVMKSEDSPAKSIFARMYVDRDRYSKEIQNSFENVDEKQSLALVRTSADSGYGYAQYELGCRYEMGDGVPQDYAEAVKWYRKAAEQDCRSYSPGPLEKLGEMYKKGLGVTKDYDEAIKWYRKAVEVWDSPQNKYLLGNMYDVAKKYSEATEWYRKAAERGHCDAQICLARCYLRGIGIRQDSKEAFKWYLKAAEQDNAQAQHEVGKFYYGGIGVSKNYSEAAKWLRKASGHGNADAQRVLGVMYMEGQGVEKNYEEAFTWFQKAAGSKHPTAYFDMAGMYECGHGVTKDIKKAFELYLKSAELGDALAQCTIASIFETGCTSLTKEKCVAIDFGESTKWYQKAAEQGFALAQYLLGVRFENGTGVSKDENEAVKWYRKAAAQGNARAQSALAGRYVLGRGVALDYGEAVKWYLKAAEQGIDTAQIAIGLLLQSGRGVERNDEEAVKWFRKAAEKGRADAQFRLGKCLRNGKGVTRDTAEAVKWYLKAAEQGNADAQYEIGIMLFCGNGVSRDPNKGTNWVIKAAEQGNVKAQCCLGGWYANWHDAENIIVPRDYVESFKWYKKAAEQGDELSQYRLGEMYYKGLGVAQNYAEAIKVFRKFADQRFDARFRLGMMYRNGEGVVRNYDEAIKWLREAANGWGDAAYELGIMYEKGIGVHKDIDEAIDWYRIAASQEHKEAIAILKKMTTEAYGTNVVTNNVDKHYEDAFVLTGGQKIEMIYCPPGEFLMGSPLIEELRATNEAQHKVTITKGFWLGKYPVTQEQWENVMGDNPSRPKGVKRPVNYVSWNDCQEFIKRLNYLIGSQTRLPTEAEWEYACRAGTRTMFYWGNVFDGSQASCRGLYGSLNRVCVVPKAPTPVDRYAPNAWGLYDMSGNMGEWCEDWYAEYKGDATDPIGPRSGEQKVFRGGSIVYEEWRCRSASRDSLPPDVRDFALGLRLCCTAE